MRKLIVMLIAVGCCTAFSTQAQNEGSNAGTTTTTSSSSSTTVTTQKSDLIKIRISELPSMVTQTLGNSEYAGWIISSAYRTKASDQYLVEVKKGTEMKSYWFDKNGNRLEGKSTKESGVDKSGSGTSGADAGSSGSGTTDK